MKKPLISPARCPGLTQHEHDAVEALFAQDLPGETLASIRRPVARSLIAKGWAEPMEATLGHDRFGPIVVHAHRLTLAGHMRYCEWASTQPHDEVP